MHGVLGSRMDNKVVVIVSRVCIYSVELLLCGFMAGETSANSES